MSNPTIYTIEQNRTITKVLTLFSDSINVYKNWGFYLFNENFNTEIELRNRIGTIIIASLFDLLDVDIRIESYQKEAHINGLVHLNRYCNQAKEYIHSVKEVLQQYTKEEQIFIINLRNQFVHSHLSGRNNNKITIKYIENNIYKKEEISIDLYHAMLEPYFLGNIDHTQQDFLNRWLNISNSTFAHRFKQKY
jgi:hypothetical protein